MAKVKNSHVVRDIEEDAPQLRAVENESAPEENKLTSDELRGLFDAWKAADKDLEAIKATVEAAAAKRSDCVKALVEALGNKGPWNVDGARLSVSVRGNVYSMSKESDAKFTL